MSLRIPDWLRYEIQQRWLTLRRRINNANPRFIISITAASVFVLLMIVLGLLTSEKTVEVQDYEKAWFYDLNTGKLFTAKSDLVPPVEAPSGPRPNGTPAGVKAYVFTYVSEPNESERFIGFLEIPDPNAEKDSFAPSSSGTGGAEKWGRGRLIRRVEDKRWIPANTAKGQAIIRELFLPNEKGQRPQYCSPQ
jgi:hypothetical protein